MFNAKPKSEKVKNNLKLQKIFQSFGNVSRCFLVCTLVFIFSNYTLINEAKSEESTDINSIIKGGSNIAPAQPASKPYSPETAQGSRMLSKAELVATGTKASVFIVSINDDAKEDKTSLASGFFIADDLIFTNAHVVEDASRLFAIDAEARHYTLKKVAVGDSDTGKDFAVLSTGSSDKHTKLLITENVKQLENIYAFGFPGIATLDDPTLRAIMNGDKKLSPNIISSGTIQEVRDNSHNVGILIHSAKISHGNSGGALLNQCGQVVGINTYLRNEKVEVQTVDGKSGTAKVDAGYSFALSSLEILKFLKSRNLAKNLVEMPCLD